MDGSCGSVAKYLRSNIWVQRWEDSIVIAHKRGWFKMWHICGSADLRIRPNVVSIAFLIVSKNHEHLCSLRSKQFLYGESFLPESKFLKDALNLRGHRPWVFLGNCLSILVSFSKISAQRTEIVIFPSFEMDHFIATFYESVWVTSAVSVWRKKTLLLFLPSSALFSPAVMSFCLNQFENIPSCSKLEHFFILAVSACDLSFSPQEMSLFSKRERWKQLSCFSREDFTEDETPTQHRRLPRDKKIETLMLTTLTYTGSNSREGAAPFVITWCKYCFAPNWMTHSLFSGFP